MENITIISNILLTVITSSVSETETTVAVITRYTYLLFLCLLLAIFVERTTEIFMSILKYIDMKKGWYKFWNKQAEKFKLRLDRLYGFQGSDTEDKKLLFRWILWSLVSEKPYAGGKEIIAAKSIRSHYYNIISKVFAFTLSLFFAIWVFKYLDLDLMDVLNKVGGTQIGKNLNNWVKIIITAIILTAGSEPMHQLIRRFEKVGKIKKV